MHAKKLRTPAQNRVIWGLVTQLAQATGAAKAEAEEAVRAICREVAGHDHTSRLTEGQADVVIARLRARLPQSPAPATMATTAASVSMSRQNAPITPRQQEVIGALYRQVGWDDRGRQIAFARRQLKLPWPQTQLHADAIIEPLKAIALRHTDPADAWRRAVALRESPHLDAWQRQFIPDLIMQFTVADASRDLTKVLSPHKLLKLIEAEVAVAMGERG